VATSPSAATQSNRNAALLKAGDRGGLHVSESSLQHVQSSAEAVDNPGYRSIFEPRRLTLGVFFPIEAFSGDEPTMRGQELLARRAEDLGFAALWVRDVPLRDPKFGDVGQVYDPWVYLGWIAAHTRRIALATGSIILPLRHPLHTAKAAASVDRLTGGRFVLGVASGDRPVEFPAFNVDYERRGELFRENFHTIRTVLTQEFPRIRNSYGMLLGDADLVPKPRGRLPMFITGHSRQTLAWIAANADGWITYPRPLPQQAELALRWRATVVAVAPGTYKPLAQSFYLDLTDDPNGTPAPIHLGFRAGRNHVLRFFDALRSAGIDHVILNFKYARRNAGELLDEVGREILPHLAAATSTVTAPSRDPSIA
jgi:luciferase-type oxidoreductase